jgi:predicted dehydrogenase
MTPRVGLVGHGRWGRNIRRDLCALGAEVHVAVPGEQSQQEALDGGAVAVYSSADQLPDLDGYVVATPTVTHATVVEALLPRQRPIFVEKPLTADLGVARSLVERAGGRIFVMHKWRYHPGIEELARIARSGQLGEIRSVNTYRLGWGNPHEDVDAIWVLAPHDLSIALEILGHLPPALSAFISGAGAPGSDLLGVLQDEQLDGPQVRIEVSANHPAPRRSVVVAGTRGSAQLADSYDDLVLVATESGTRSVGVSNEMPLLLELRAFLDHLAGGPGPRSSAGDALVVLERIQSLRTLAGL